MKYVTVSDQTILDVSAEVYGSVEHAHILADDNKIEITDYVEPGTELEVQEPLIEPYYRKIANGYGTIVEGNYDPRITGWDYESGGEDGRVVTKTVDGGEDGEPHIQTVQKSNV